MTRRALPYQTVQRCHDCGAEVLSGWPMIIHLSTRHRQAAAPLLEPEPDWADFPHPDDPDGPAEDPPESWLMLAPGPDHADHPLGARTTPTPARVDLGTSRVDPAGGEPAGTVAAGSRRGPVAAERSGALSAAEAGVERV